MIEEYYTISSGFFKGNSTIAVVKSGEGFGDRVEQEIRDHLKDETLEIGFVFELGENIDFFADIFKNGSPYFRVKLERTFLKEGDQNKN